MSTLSVHVVRTFKRYEIYLWKQLHWRILSRSFFSHTAMIDLQLCKCLIELLLSSEDSIFQMNILHNVYFSFGLFTFSSKSLLSYEILNANVYISNLSLWFILERLICSGLAFKFLSFSLYSSFQMLWNFIAF